MTEMDLYADGWMDLSWSDWRSLDPQDAQLSSISTDPGLYRVRHLDRDGLEYIGETGRSTRGRVRALARNVYSVEMPFRDPHTAAPCLWAVCDQDGSELEVSTVAPPRATDEQIRKGLEAAMIAVARRKMGESPTANFGRIVDGYTQSSYRKDGDVGGPLPDGETEVNAESGVGPTDWTSSEAVTAPDWMGLDWSEPFRLRDRLDASPPDIGLYRIWFEGEAPPLAYIGESSNLSRRLYKHESTYGGDAFFSYVVRPDLDASHKRQEIETELIGAHMLRFEEPPITQFGHTEKLSTDV